MSAATVRVAQPFIRTPSQVVAVFLTRGLWHGPPHGSTPAHGGDVRDDLSRFSLWRCSLARSIAYRIERFVTSRSDAEAAACAAVDRFGRVDVLVNNAASFYAGYFEELTPEQFERQLSVSLIGPLNVTRAVLPVMRKQRAGHIISISSSAGLAAGFDFVSAYAASKFGLERWMESLQAEVHRSASPPPSSTPASFAPSSSRSNPRTTPSRPSQTTTSVEGRWPSIGNLRTGGNPAIRRSSRELSSPLPASRRRRAASSRAPMPSPPPGRRLPI